MLLQPAAPARPPPPPPGCVVRAVTRCPWPFLLVVGALMGWRAGVGVCGPEFPLDHGEACTIPVVSTEVNDFRTRGTTISVRQHPALSHSYSVHPNVAYKLIRPCGTAAGQYRCRIQAKGRQRNDCGQNPARLRGCSERRGGCGRVQHVSRHLRTVSRRTDMLPTSLERSSARLPTLRLLPRSGCRARPHHTHRPQARQRAGGRERGRGRGRSRGRAAASAARADVMWDGATSRFGARSSNAYVPRGSDFMCGRIRVFVLGTPR